MTHFLPPCNRREQAPACCVSKQRQPLAAPEFPAHRSSVSRPLPLAREFLSAAPEAAGGGWLRVCANRIRKNKHTEHREHRVHNKKKKPHATTAHKVRKERQSSRDVTGQASVRPKSSKARSRHEAGGF